MRALGLFAASAVTAVGYGVLSSAVFDGQSRRADGRTRTKVLAHVSDRAKRLADATGHLGKWYTHVPLALGGAAVLVATRRPVAGAALGAASLAAAALSRVLDRVHDHRRPPPGKDDPDAQSYPSGHALETTAVTATAAWVLARERLAPAAAVVPAAIALSLVSGLGRLILDRHWSTDSLAGYAAGVALAAACAGAYELARG